MSKLMVRIDVDLEQDTVKVAGFQMQCKTLVNARDYLIKQDKSATKFPFGNKLVGFKSNRVLTFLFEQDHPVFKLVAANKHNDPKFSQGLIDLYNARMQEYKAKPWYWTVVAIDRKTGEVGPFQIGRWEMQFSEKEAKQIAVEYEERRDAYTLKAMPVMRGQWRHDLYTKKAA